MHMSSMRKLTILLLTIVAVSSATSAFAGDTLKLYPAAVGDGYAGRSWYGWYGSWATTNEASVNFWHNGENRESGRGMVIINIASLSGASLAPNSAWFNFYSYGISGTSLQWFGGDPGPEVVLGYSQAGGTELMPLNGIGEGWQKCDVTSYLQSGINAGQTNVGFIFNVTQNMCGGSVGSVEGQKPCYLEVVPEPSSVLVLISGVTGLVGMALRRKSA